MTDPVSSNPSIPVRAGNAFAAKFGREPASASDSAWLNGYAESLTEIERLTRDRDHFQACWNAVAGIRAERDRLRTVVWQMQRYVASPSPCRICGYNGPGFWQPDSHACAALSGEPGSAVETSERRSLQQQVMSFLSAGVNTGLWNRDIAYDLVRQMLDAKWNESRPLRSPEIMDIYSPVGSKIVFAFPRNGYPSDVAEAARRLVEGQTYTLSRIEVHSSHTNVWLKELPDYGPFNSVQFSNAQNGKGDL